MREIRTSGSEGGELAYSWAAFLPLSRNKALGMIFAIGVV